MQQINAATLFVTNTNDAGAGSFRAILASANNGDVIQFNIPGPGPYTIQPLTAYSVSRQVTIDGLVAGKPWVEFDGALSTSIAGFDFNSPLGSGSVIQGLVLNNFSYNPNPMVDLNACAISITQASNVTVKSCYIGTDVTGTTAKPNKHGIWINGSSNNMIGGSNVTDGNIISGNMVRGVWVSAQGGTATNNTVENNTVGINISGAALPNITGVEFNLNAKNNLIQHNNISYNGGDGLSFNQGSTGNKIYGNIFSNNGEHGVDFLNGDVMNNVVGVDINGVGEPNQIFNNSAAGVFISEWFDGSVYNYGAPSKVTVRKNSIYCNGVKGIALTEVTGAFTSSAGNNGKASPVINPKSNEEKTYGTAAVGDIIDIYVADACNACNSGNSQGKTWLTSMVVGAGGTWSYTNPTPGGALCYSLIVTATDAQGNTSEFASMCTRPSVAINDTSTCGTINLNLDVTHPCAVSYKWSTGATTPTLVLNNAAPGLYWVELKGSDNVPVRDTFNINPGVSFAVNLGADLYRCTNPFSPSVVLDPGLPNAYTYLWSTGSTSSSISVSTRGQYFVKVTDPSSGCTGSDTMDILPNVLPAPVLTNAQFCEGDSVTLNPGNFSTYKWSDNSTAPTLKVKTSGVYWVVVANDSGCTDSVSATITVFPTPTLNISDTSVCKGASVTFSAGAFSSYLWSTSETTSSVTVSAEGIYTVNVTDNNGCKTMASPKLTFYPDPVVSITPRDPSICAGTSVNLDAVTLNVTYNWSTSENAKIISVSSAGKYVVEITDVNQCKAKDSIVVTVIPKDSASFSTTDYCLSDAPTQAVFLPGNTAGGAFSFTTNVVDGASINVSTGEITNGQGGTTYSIQYITPGTCKDTAVENVLVMNNPVFTLQPQDVSVCINDPAQFSVSANFALTYQWQSSNDGINFMDLSEVSPYSGTLTNTLNVNPVDATMDLLQFRCIARSDFCEKISNVATLFYGKNITIGDPVAPAVCEGSGLQLTAVAAGALSYQWQYSDDNGISYQNVVNGVAYSNAQTSLLSINSVASSMDGYRFRCYAVGCVNTDTSLFATITLIPNTLIVTQPKDSAICANGDAAFTLTASNALTYEWYVSTNSGTSYSAIANGGNYSGASSNTLKISDASGMMNGSLYYCKVSGTCNDVLSDTALLKVTDPTVDMIAPESVCPEVPFNLTASSNYLDAEFFWNGVKQKNNPVSDSISTESTYVVTAVMNGCESTPVSKIIKIIPIRIPVAANDTVVCSGSEIKLGITEIPEYNYQWTSTNGDITTTDVQPVVIPEVNTTYVVTAKNTTCAYTMTDSISVTVLDGVKIYYPNAFTPNDDMVNDVFKVVGEGIVDFDAMIFDRWGEIIYQWNSIDGGWDGRAKNQSQVQIDVYVLKMKVGGVCEDKSFIGTVTVMR